MDKKGNTAISMKILIIALPRTGSTELMKKISKESNLKPIFEPFDKTQRNIFDENEDNIVVKTIIHQHKDNYDLCKKFTKIVLLGRKNLKECAESYTYFLKNRLKGFRSNQPYYYEDIEITEYEIIFKRIQKYNKQLNELSSLLGEKITYYEDIYNTKSKDRLRKYKKIEPVVKTKIV